jgi:hypothetical protein
MKLRDLFDTVMQKEVLRHKEALPMDPSLGKLPLPERRKAMNASLDAKIDDLIDIYENPITQMPGVSIGDLEALLDNGTTHVHYPSDDGFSQVMTRGMLLRAARRLRLKLMSMAS